MKRLFLAVKIKDEMVSSVLDSMKSKLGLEKITWVNPALLHLTLKFFGDTEEKMIPDICNCIKKALENQTAINITTGNIRLFGSSYQPKVIWFGVKDEGKLAVIVKKLNEQLLSINIKPTSENFVPHITAARIRQLKDKKYFQSIIDQHQQDFFHQETIEQVILYESKLERTGPVYKVVETFSLE